MYRSIDLQTSPDEQAILMLCSQLGLSANENGNDTQPKPFALNEWNRLARTLAQSELGGPAGLIGLDASAIASSLGLLLAEGERIARLLERGGMLAIELERLASRGIWALTRASDRYPSRLRRTLRHMAPAVLFGSGSLSLAAQNNLAIVGSRDVDASGETFATWVSEWAARSGVGVVSGAARGVDRVAMWSAIGIGGTAVGVLADSLERTLQSVDVRRGVAEGSLLLMSPYHPKASFSVGAAMGRNKIVYGLSDAAVIVSASAGTGGTWAGAIEALKTRWVPVFVRVGDNAPPGNVALVREGALPFSYTSADSAGDVAALLSRAAPAATRPSREGHQPSSELDSASAYWRADRATSISTSTETVVASKPRAVAEARVAAATRDGSRSEERTKTHRKGGGRKANSSTRTTPAGGGPDQLALDIGEMP